MSERWTPRVDGTRMLLEERGLAGPVEHVIGELDRPVAESTWRALVQAMAPYHRDSGPDWMVRAAREALTGLGGRVVLAETRVGVEDGWPTPPSAPPGSPLDDDWIRWVAEAAVSGRDRDRIVAFLREHYDRGLADAVDGVLDSPILEGSRRAARQARAMQQIARLRRGRERLASLEVREPAGFDTERFVQEAWTPHRPVVLRGAAARWPAWTLESLRARFGAVRVEVMRGRQSPGPAWWKRREELAVEMPLFELLDQVEHSRGNDLYAVARNQLSARIPALAREIGPLPGIAAGSPVHVWIGPRGTVTPLHHDQSAGWLVQRIGRKKLWLASPLELSLLDHADGLHNHVDPRDPESPVAGRVHFFEVEIGPGDAIFLPAGWWHLVESVTPSVSVSLTGFEWPSNALWYLPGDA